MFGSELQSALTAMGLSVTEEQLRQFDVFPVMKRLALRRGRPFSI